MPVHGKCFLASVMNATSTTGVRLLNALGNANNPAEHLEISGAGHQVHYDQPEQLALAAQNFLANVN